MKDINDTVAANIVREMKKRKTKQIELAEAIGVTKQMMSKMLNGTRLITIAELKKTASYFDVSVDTASGRYLLGEIYHKAGRRSAEHRSKKRIQRLLITHSPEDYRPTDKRGKSKYHSEKR